MKKIVAIIAFLGLWAASGQAQYDLRFGFQLSPAFSWMNTNTNKINNSGSNLGLKLGVIGEYYFQENYAITSGIGFFFNTGGTLLHERRGDFWVNTEILQGCRDATLSQTGTKLKYNLQYLEIPLGLKMRTREFGYVRYFLEPNIGLGFRTQANGDITSLGDECQDLNINEDVNFFNLFWGISGGLEYNISESTTLIGGAGLQFGFADASKDDDTVILEDGSTQAAEKANAKINAFIIRLGILF